MIRSDDEMCFAWVAAPRLDQHHQQRHSGKQKSFHRHFHFFVSIIIIFSTRVIKISPNMRMTLIIKYAVGRFTNKPRKGKRTLGNPGQGRVYLFTSCLPTRSSSLLTLSFIKMQNRTLMQRSSQSDVSRPRQCKIFQVCIQPDVYYDLMQICLFQFNHPNLSPIQQWTNYKSGGKSRPGLCSLVVLSATEKRKSSKVYGKYASLKCTIKNDGLPLRNNWKDLIFR